MRRTGSGNAILIGYIAPDPRSDTPFDTAASLEILRRDLPAALVPRLAVVDDLPTRTSGKIDRDALPWPLAGADDVGPELDLPGTEARVRDLWAEVLGARVSSAKDDFFDLGGGSLTAAQMVSRLRTTHPEITVADIYDHPTLSALARHLDDMTAPTSRLNKDVAPVPLKTQVGQVLATWPLRTLSGLRWLTWVAAGANLAAALPIGPPWVPTVSWWWVALGWAVLILPPGRMVAGALGARLSLAGVGPGSYPRGGRVHLRMWLAERLLDELGTANLSGAVLMRWYARLLGATIAKDVDLHTIPPVTGLLHLGAGCAIEPEVDLTGYWVDGGRLQIGAVHVGPRARVGARSTLAPGAHVGAAAEIAPGSAVFGIVPDGEYWSGAPAQRIGPARGPFHDTRPDNRPRWLVAYAASSVVVALLPILAVVAGAAVAWPALRSTATRADAVRTALIWLPLGTVVAVLVLTVSVWLAVRLLAIGLVPGGHPVQGRVAWQAWSTVRVLDEARTWLFPLYSSTLTPTWLRALGARIGPDVEASTVLLIPRLTSVAEGAFLADDTLIGGYELGGGWLRVEPVTVGKHAFVGNSGMAAPGRKVPKRGLVAVLSAAPHRSAAKAGTSWIGSPPALLRRTAARTDQSRTYHPAQRMRVARAAVELCRVVPLMLHVALLVAVIAVLLALAERAGWWAAALASGVVLMAAGAVAAGLATAAKWLLVGRVTRRDHPLWSSFVWRNELADTFVEVLAAPWFARAATGTPVLNVWLRTMGATIGRGVWCETYWLPEADLIDLRDGVTVNRGCVVQTHLFHDRVLSMDTVSMRAGSTLGPNGVILPAATIGRHATVGPVSLVMRGESVPDKTRWIGNPIGPWSEG